MLSRHTHLCALSLVAALFASPAFATPFELTGTAGGTLTAGDLTGYVSDPGLNGGAAEHVYIGPLNMTVTDLGAPLSGTNPIQQTVYCTDIFDNFVSGGSYTLVANGLTSLGSVKLNQLNALLSNTLATAGVNGAAVQAAIWEIMNEPSLTFGYDVDTSPFKASVDAPNESAFQSTVHDYLLHVSGTNGTNGDWHPDSTTVINEYVPVPGQSNQSFGFLTANNGGNAPPVPEPASLSLLGLGLFGAALARRRGGHRQVRT